MKRFLIIFFLFLNLTSLAQSITSYCIYAIHNWTVLDRSFNEVDNIQSNSGDPMGLFSISQADGKKYIVVTLGKEPVYEIQVVNEVKGKPENGVRIDMLQGGMHFQGQVVVINVFLEYDVNKRTTIPDAITIDVNNSPNFIQLKGLVSVGK